MPITLKQNLSANPPPAYNYVQFGERNTLSVDHILCGTLDFPSPNAGAVWVFDKDPITGVYSHKRTLSAAAGSNHYYGASNDVNTSYIYIGAPGAGSINSGIPEGRVYEINNSGGSRFSVNATITPNANLGRKGFFGACVKLVNASNLFITSLWAQPRGAGIRTGAIYHYIKSGGTWNYTAVISGKGSGANQPSNNDEYGFTFDGDTSELIVGSPQRNQTTADGKGAAYVMVPDGTDANSWITTQYIEIGSNPNPHQGQPGDMFGYRIVKGTNYAFIAAPRYQINSAINSQPGAVFMYERIPGSPDFWSYTCIITAHPGDSNSSRFEFGLSMAYNEANNYILIGADAINDSRGLVFGFDVSNKFSPVQSFVIERPVSIPNSNFGHDVKLLPGTDNGLALIGSYGAIVNPDNGSVYPPGAGAAFLFNDVNNFVVTPSPTVTPSLTPSPTPNPTPVFKPANWYGLNILDPISVGDGGEAGGYPTGANYPKAPSRGGPGRNYSILREIGAALQSNPNVYDFDTYRGSLYRLALAYTQLTSKDYGSGPLAAAPIALFYNLNSSNPTAMSEFYRSRGVSLGFSYKLERKQVTQSKYCDSSNGGVRITIPFYSAQNRYGNPIRTTTYTITIGASTSVGNSKTVEGLGTAAQSWSIVDNFTGYTRSGTVDVGCGTNSYSTIEDVDYRREFPRNPP